MQTSPNTIVSSFGEWLFICQLGTRRKRRIILSSNFGGIFREILNFHATFDKNEVFVHEYFWKVLYFNLLIDGDDKSFGKYEMLVIRYALALQRRCQFNKLNKHYFKLFIFKTFVSLERRLRYFLIQLLFDVLVRRSDHGTSTRCLHLRSNKYHDAQQQQKPQFLID